MGRAQRPRPIRLYEKLLQIRLTLGLSQQEMLELLDYRQSPLFIGHISQFEQDKREPPMPLLLQYARVSGVCLERLVDDELSLPETMKPLKNQVRKIMTAIRNFDVHESRLLHDQLEIIIPAGFYRYDQVTRCPDKEWDSVDVALFYIHRELKFSIHLVERSHIPSFTIVEHRCRRDCVTEYRVVEEIALSIRDARSLVNFLQDYFHCFYLKISTKLSK